MKKRNEGKSDLDLKDEIESAMNPSSRGQIFKPVPKQTTFNDMHGSVSAICLTGGRNLCYGDQNTGPGTYFQDECFYAPSAKHTSVGEPLEFSTNGTGAIDYYAGQSDDQTPFVHQASPRFPTSGTPPPPLSKRKMSAKETLRDILSSSKVQSRLSKSFSKSTSTG